MAKINKSLLSKKMAAMGFSVATALSAGFLLIPHEGEVKDKQGMHVVYADPVGINTYCWGLTGKDMYGNHPKLGHKYTEQECLTMFSDRVRHFEKAVELYTKVPFASTFQKASLISFAYNVGAGAYQTSSLLRDLNSGNHDGACERLLDWKYAGGKVLPGLVTRRAEEKSWCTGDVPYEAVVTFSDISEIVRETYLLQNPDQK